ncbi:hypothetical protein HII31_03230 [Pseudocercospora fuligena]|uniref:Uncharacterized protein n=1 Tax=Pseudocercospora fuligena TaxID=685502 RepID=A0A8H6RR06_9PEZI|nr:hypothetical protein HII31_03230 [Pseudocercospora fuligena]
MPTLEQCLVEAVERLPKLQHIVIAANPAAVESDTSGHYSGDILNADSQWIVSLKGPNEDSALLHRTGARASPADILFNYALWADDSRFFWGLAPLFEAMAYHADRQPEVPLNFTLQGRVPVGTGELLEFDTSQSATFNKAMGHIKNFYVRATLDHQGIYDEPGVVNSEAYEKMLLKLQDNVQGLGILTNRSRAQQADVLSVLLRHPTLRFQRLQGVQFLASVAIFDPAVEWVLQQWVPLLHTGQQLFQFLCRHRTTLKCLALDCVSGVHKINPQGGLEIGTLQGLVRALRMPKRFGRLQWLRIAEIVNFGDLPGDIGLPRAQVLDRQAADEASSGLRKLARELHAMREGYVCSTASDGTIALQEYNGSSAGTATATHVKDGVSAAAQPGEKDNVDTEATQSGDLNTAEPDSTAMETVSLQDSDNDNGTGDNAENATATVVPETASVIESNPDIPEKEQLSQPDNADTAAAQAAAPEQAGTDDGAEEEVIPRDSENDNGPDGNAKAATPLVVPQTAAAIDGSPGAFEKEPLRQQDNIDIAAVQASAPERAEADATAGEEVSTRDSSNDSGTGEDDNHQHLIFAYEFRLEAVKSNGK